MFASCAMKKRTAGYTLLELLLALSIFSLLSIMSYSGLKSVLDAQASGERVSDRLSQLSIALLLFERDLVQMVDRPIWGKYGEKRDSLLGGYHLGLLEFTAAGGGTVVDKRSALRRVVYRWQDEQMIRESWRVLDRVQDSQPLQEVLLDKVKLVDLRFLTVQREWVTVWQMSEEENGEEEGGAVQSPMPVAIELIIDVSGMGEIRRLIALPAAEQKTGTQDG